MKKIETFDFLKFINLSANSIIQVKCQTGIEITQTLSLFLQFAHMIFSVKIC